jgi:hypothetical protein
MYFPNIYSYIMANLRNHLSKIDHFIFHFESYYCLAVARYIARDVYSNFLNYLVVKAHSLMEVIYSWNDFNWVTLHEHYLYSYLLFSQEFPIALTAVWGNSP